MADPCPKNPRQLFAPKAADVPLEDRPLDLAFTLPDHTPARVVENASSDVIEVSVDGKPVATFARQAGQQARVSLHGVVQDHRAQHEDIWDLSVAVRDSPANEVRATWTALYGFWLRRDPYERLPVRVVDSERAHRYLVHTGLGFTPPDAQTPTQLLLDRAAFYQGAGAPLGLSWLQAPEPNGATEFGPLTSSAFPHVLSFTRRDDPPVLTTHPLRPPKPAPGSLVYSRFIPALGQHFDLYHIDPHGEAHFAAYSRWQNSDRVNVGWRERGDDEHHRRYLLESLADPHKMGYIFAWDGELAGYAEANWNKENGMAAFVGGCGPWDQGTHMLNGEEKFRGRQRFTSIMVSLKHMCFLREPRTDIVIGEPRFDLPIIPLLKHYLPQDVVKEVELPHKRAVFFELRRERFFLEGIFY